MTKPLIGITCGLNETKYELYKVYIDEIAKAGGSPVILCPGFDAIEKLDGLILSGGDDIAAKYAGTPESPLIKGVDAERDELELSLCRHASKRGMKILGICRGAQMINCAFGGSLHYDIDECLKPNEEHSYKGAVLFHDINITPGTLLHSLLGDKASVNSYHHQAVNSVAPRFSISARSNGGVIEAIENADRNILGVQWHPEKMGMKELFQWLIKA